MRDIKFRHFDTRLTEMRYSDKHDGEFYINTKGVLYMYAIPKSESGNTTEFYKSYDVMQYTGIQDKNDVEIYEGDVVYIAGFGNSIATLNTIFGLEFVDCLDEYRHRSGYSAYNESDIGEVLGNIYQDKHLLT